MNKKIIEQCRKIKVMITDVDGVLTDGGMFYSHEGDIMKKFHTRDGMGVTLLRKNNIPTIIITKEKNKIISKWAKKMGIENLYDGVLRKETVLLEITKKMNVSESEICYIGDDVNDIEILKKVGLSVSPYDAIELAKKTSNIITKSKGGEGVLREVADTILSIKFPHRTNFY